MSLIGQLPLAAISISCKNINESRRFYRDLIGLRIIEEEEKGDRIHFDLGNIRLSLIGKPSPQLQPHQKKGGVALAADPSASSGKLGTSDHLIFVVESAIDQVYADLEKRGVKFKSKRVVEDSMGKAAWFTDPDGRVIYLWQPPRRDAKGFRDVEMLVRHYESVSRALADLREGEEEEEGITV